MEIINPKRAMSFHLASERRERTQAIGIDRAKKMNWRRTIAYAEPLAFSE
jgi:hypothetical protein